MKLADLISDLRELQSTFGNVEVLVDDESAKPRRASGTYYDKEAGENSRTVVIIQTVMMDLAPWGVKL